MSKKAVGIDIDDTLILWNVEGHPEQDIIEIERNGVIMKAVPHFRHIQFIRNLYVQGYYIVGWSAAGKDWVDKVLKLLKIEDLFDHTQSKFEFVMDDLPRADQIIKTIVYFDPITGEKVGVEYGTK